MPRYALFKDEKQVTEACTAKYFVLAEAFEKKIAGVEFRSGRGGFAFKVDKNLEIRQLPEVSDA